MKFTIFVALMFLAAFIPGGKTVSILEHPQTQRVAAGSGSVTFECRGQGEMGWWVDDQYVAGTYREALKADGFTFDSDHYSTHSDLTMTAPAITSRNGTEIQCEAYTPSETAFSNVARLWVIGPPLPPNVSVELTSWNTMRLSWTAPFTAQGFPIDKYIVHTTNSSTGQRNSTDLYPTDGSETLTIVDTPSNCHSLSFEVEAESSAGTSSASLVSRGFPVAVTGFHVDISVILTLPDHIPLATISFKLPEVCATDSGVAATYIVELRTSSGELVHRTAAEYHDSILIEETQTVDTCSSYTLNVTVSVPSFPELGSHTNITKFDVQIDKCLTKESPTPSVSVTHSQTVSRNGGSSPGVGRVKAQGSQGSVSTVVLGVVAAVLLLVVVAGVCGVVAVFVLRRRRITAERQALHRPLPSMAPNPLYESATPLYDVIPENCACKVQPDGETEQKAPSPEDSRKQLVVDDWCRYATIPSSLGHLLDREDSGICDPLREREWGEEPQRETEREKEDCYIIMQSCADKQEST